MQTISNTKLRVGLHGPPNTGRFLFGYIADVLALFGLALQNMLRKVAREPGSVCPLFDQYLSAWLGKRQLDIFRFPIKYSCSSKHPPVSACQERFSAKKLRFLYTNIIAGFRPVTKSNSFYQSFYFTFSLGFICSRLLIVKSTAKRHSRE